MHRLIHGRPGTLRGRHLDRRKLSASLNQREKSRPKPRGSSRRGNTTQEAGSSRSVRCERRFRAGGPRRLRGGLYALGIDECLDPALHGPTRPRYTKFLVTTGRRDPIHGANLIARTTADKPPTSHATRSSRRDAASGDLASDQSGSRPRPRPTGRDRLGRSRDPLPRPQAGRDDLDSINLIVNDENRSAASGSGGDDDDDDDTGPRLVIVSHAFSRAQQEYVEARHKDNPNAPIFYKDATPRARPARRIFPRRRGA